MASVNKRPRTHDVTAFPQMTNVEICDCLAALGINVQMEDIAKPTPNSAQMIFAALVDCLMGSPMEMAEGTKATLMGMMEYKELYGDALQFTMFFRHCRELATVCGIKSFHLADLTRPDPQKFKSHLSGVMNFAKFRDERQSFHISLQQKMADQMDKAERLAKQLDKVNATIEDITARSAEDRPRTEEAKKRNDLMRAELMTLRSEQLQLSHDVEELKKERQSLMELASSKSHELSSLTKGISEARSRIVQSPERIKRHISEMSTSVAAEKNMLAGVHAKARKLGNRLEVLNALEMDLKGLIDLERGIEEQRSRGEEKKREVSKMRIECNKKTQELENLKARIGQLERQLAHAQDRLQRVQQSLHDLRDKSKAKHDALHAEYEARRKERTGFQKKIQRLQAEQKEVDLEMKAFTDHHEAEINEMLQEYWTMRKQAEDYMNTITVQLSLRLDEPDSA